MGMSDNNNNNNKNKKQEIVYQDEQEIKKVEREIDAVWNESLQAKEKGDLNKMRELQHKAEAMRPPLVKMREVALNHVNGKELNKGSIKHKDFT